jgi:hypothetical protein
MNPIDMLAPYVRVACQATSMATDACQSGAFDRDLPPVHADGGGRLSTNQYKPSSRAAAAN